MQMKLLLKKKVLTATLGETCQVGHWLADPISASILGCKTWEIKSKNGWNICRGKKVVYAQKIYLLEDQIKIRVGQYD